MVRAFTGAGRVGGAHHPQARRGAGGGGPGDRAAAGRGGARRARSRDRRGESLAAAMIGARRPRSAAARAARRRDAAAGRRPARVLVRLEELEVPRETGYGIAVRRATLVVRAGEIVGIAAVEGNGQRELLRAVAGRLHAAPRPARGGGTGRLHSRGPHDRGTDPDAEPDRERGARRRADEPWIRRGRVDWRVARARTAALLAEYEVVAPGPRRAGGDAERRQPAEGGRGARAGPAAARGRGGEPDPRARYPGRRGDPRAAARGGGGGRRRARLLERSRRGARAGRPGPGGARAAR